MPLDKYLLCSHAYAHLRLTFNFALGIHLHFCSADDNIVDIRASSRGKPDQSDGQVSLSLSKGVVYDQNIAQRQLERLRKAMQWESVPVITGFDPRYNQSQQLFFEKLYQPFLSKSQKTISGDIGP